MSRYRVYLDQVNQTFVYVSAKDHDDAAEKGLRKWRREYGTRVLSVKLISNGQARPRIGAAGAQMQARDRDPGIQQLSPRQRRHNQRTMESDGGPAPCGERDAVGDSTL